MRTDTLSFPPKCKQRTLNLTISYETNRGAIEIHSHICTETQCWQKKKKKKAIYSSSLQYGASPGAEIAAEGRIISSQLMGDANKAEKNPTKTMNAKQNPSKLISFAEC